MAFPWKIRPFFTNWRVSFGQTIDGVDVDVLQGSSPTGMIGTLYFDKKTGLLKRYIRYANTMVGRIPTQVDYDDYRDVAGVKMPFKYSYAWVSERDDWTFDELRAERRDRQREVRPAGSEDGGQRRRTQGEVDHPSALPPVTPALIQGRRSLVRPPFTHATRSVRLHPDEPAARRRASGMLVSRFESTRETE